MKHDTLVAASDKRPHVHTDANEKQAYCHPDKAGFAVVCASSCNSAETGLTPVCVCVCVYACVCACACVCVCEAGGMTPSCELKTERINTEDSCDYSLQAGVVILSLSVFRVRLLLVSRQFFRSHEFTFHLFISYL